MTKTFIETLAEKKKISVEYAIDSFKDALSNVYLSEYEGANIDVEYNKNNDSFIIHRNFKVVSDEFADDENSSYDDENEIPLSKAKKINPKISINATIGQDITLEGLDKHLQKKIMQTLNHNISIESNKFIYKNWNDKKGKVISSEVISEENGKYTVKINEEIFGILPYDEQIKGEKLQLGKKYSFFVKDVLEHSRDWPIILSRADIGLIKYFINLNVPEVQENIIEIKKIARLAGIKTKIVVNSLQEGIDPIGSMIGPGGSRINAIKKEINNEQIDIVKYNDDLKTYITNICYPVKINSVIISDDLISIICNESENNTDMQKLIGRQGSNIKLIQKLLDRTVEIISVSELDELKNDISVNNEKVEYSNFGLKNTRKSFTPTPRRDKSDTGTTDYEDLMNEFNKD